MISDNFSPEIPLPKSAPNKVHFVSLGCPKNLVDTEIMVGSLMKEGYEIVPEADLANTVVINTCGFIEEAKQESIDKILEMGQLKSQGKIKELVVAGCLAQRYQTDLVEGFPEADLFLGSGHFQEIGHLLAQNRRGQGARGYFELPTFLQNSATPRTNTQPRHRAYIKISEGCKKRCSFCAIPLIRGSLQSREIPAVVAEAKLLVAGGVRELTVISHDFTDFGWDLRKRNAQAQESPLELLRQLSDQSGADWIRVLYLYPDGVTPELVALIKERDNLVKYFDMPLQHINNEMLKKMNRRMVRAQIEEAVQLVRSEIPEAILRTQFIVGFPGETQEQFEEILDFLENNPFDRVGVFAYSQEEDTKAGLMDGQLDSATKQQRFDQLMRFQAPISRMRQKKMVGRIVPVLVEGLAEETDLLLQGRHSGQAAEIDGVTYVASGCASVGDLVSVLITDSHDYDLVGEIVDGATAESLSGITT